MGGAMKATNDGRYVHVSCALWTPESTVDDADPNIVDLHAIPRARWLLVGLV